MYGVLVKKNPGKHRGALGAIMNETEITLKTMLNTMQSIHQSIIQSKLNTPFIIALY